MIRSIMKKIKDYCVYPYQKQLSRMKKFKDYCVYLYQKYPFRTILGFIFMCFFFLLLTIHRVDTANVLETLQFIVFMYILYFIFLIISLPVINEINLYIQYHKTLNDLKNLEYSIENHCDKTVQYKLNNFIKRYDFLRKNIKRSVTKSKSYLYSHNQETVCILKDIDLFFDVTVKLIMKKEYDLYTNNLSTDNLNIIYTFLKIFNKLMFIDFKFSNILLVNEFFEKQNSYLENTQEELFEKTKTRIENQYLDKSRYSNWRSSIIHALIPIIIASIIKLIYLIL